MPISCSGREPRKHKYEVYNGAFKNLFIDSSLDNLDQNSTRVSKNFNELAWDSIFFPRLICQQTAILWTYKAEKMLRKTNYLSFIEQKTWELLKMKKKQTTRGKTIYIQNILRKEHLKVLTGLWCARFWYVMS